MTKISVKKRIDAFVQQLKGGDELCHAYVEGKPMESQGATHAQYLVLTCATNDVLRLYRFKSGNYPGAFNVLQTYPLDMISSFYIRVVESPQYVLDMATFARGHFSWACVPYHGLVKTFLTTMRDLCDAIPQYRRISVQIEKQLQLHGFYESPNFVSESAGASASEANKSEREESNLDSASLANDETTQPVANNLAGEFNDHAFRPFNSDDNPWANIYERPSASSDPWTASNTEDDWPNKPYTKSNLGHPNPSEGNNMNKSSQPTGSTNTNRRLSDSRALILASSVHSFVSPEDKDTAEQELIDNDKGEIFDFSLSDICEAPLITRAVFMNNYKALRQYGVIGSIQSIQLSSQTSTVEEPQHRLYLNIDSPFSAVLCGAPGSGIEHTLAIMIENMTVREHVQIGNLTLPLASLVLHFGEGGDLAEPCKAAWVGVPSAPNIKTPAVRVYVSPTSVKAMRQTYSRLGPSIKVEPLYFNDEEIDAEMILSLTEYGSQESQALYSRVVKNILRLLGNNYTWKSFQSMLEAKIESMSAAQHDSIVERIDILRQFTSNSQVGTKHQAARFQTGQITIVDLSDPLLDQSSACGIFQMMIRLLIRANIYGGKVVVANDAHQYLSSSNPPPSFVQTLLYLVRNSYTTNTRVMFSTQEPTVLPPAILELCSMTIIHRFSSRQWWEHLKRNTTVDFGSCNFESIVRLPNRGMLVVASSAFIASRDKNGALTPERLGCGNMLVMGRRLVTQKGRM